MQSVVPWLLKRSVCGMSVTGSCSGLSPGQGMWDIQRTVWLALGQNVLCTIPSELHIHIAGLWYPSSRVQTPVEAVGFLGVNKNPQHVGGHGCLSVVIVVCCQVEVSATG